MLLPPPPLLALLALTLPPARASINIKTLPPDLTGTSYPVPHVAGSRNVVDTDWTGDHSAELDGDLGRVWLSWAIRDQYVEFKVSPTGCVLVWVSSRVNLYIYIYIYSLSASKDHGGNCPR